MNDLNYIIYFGILAVCLIVGTLRINLLNTTNKVFLGLIFLTIIVELIARKVGHKGKSNFIVYHFFTPIQCSLVLLGYYFDLKKKVLLYLTPSMLLLGVILSLWIQPLPLVNSYYMNIELLLFTALAIEYFRSLLLVQTNITLKSFSLFWISCGLLIFCTMNIFLLGAFNYFYMSNVVTDENILSIFFKIRFFSNYIYYSSFIVAFLVKQNTISDQHGK